MTSQGVDNLTSWQMKKQGLRETVNWGVWTEKSSCASTKCSCPHGAVSPGDPCEDIWSPYVIITMSHRLLQTTVAPRIQSLRGFWKRKSLHLVLVCGQLRWGRGKGPNRQASTEGLSITREYGEAGGGQEEGPLVFVTLKLWPQSLTDFWDYGWIWFRLGKGM